MVENKAIDWQPNVLDGLIDVGHVSAPSTPGASSVDVSARTLTGQAAVFKLTPHGSSSCPNDSCVLAALASVIVATDSLHIACVGGASAVDLPVGIEVSVELDCVFLIVAVPADTPDGSVVLIKDVGVAGCAVVLNEMSSRVTIGFNHAPAPEGAVFAAAAAGDESGLEVALFDGGSTEECEDYNVSDVMHTIAAKRNMWPY